MQPYKQSKEDFASSSPSSRVSKLKWWFLLLIAVGIAALVAVLVNQGEKATDAIQKSGLEQLFISTAYAQDSAEPAETTDVFTPKLIIMSGVFVVLGVVYLAGIVKLFFTSNADQVDTAADLVKTLTGFFVGAATGFLG